MKFNKLFAASLALALSASDVSAKYQNQLRGIASSVLLEDSSWSADSNSGGDSNSQDGFGHRTSTRNWESKDSSADSNSRGDSNSQDGFGFGHRTSTRNWEPADSSADSNSRGDSNSQDGFGHRTSTRNWESADSSGDVSAAKYPLRGIASSVLLEDSPSGSGSRDSNSQDYRNIGAQPRLDDSSADFNSNSRARGDSNSQDQDGFGLHRTWNSVDSSADSKAIADSNSSDEPDYYYEDFFTTN
jgi:hypothetical protein